MAVVAPNKYVQPGDPGAYDWMTAGAAQANAKYNPLISAAGRDLTQNPILRQRALDLIAKVYGRSQGTLATGLKQGTSALNKNFKFQMGGAATDQSNSLADLAAFIKAQEDSLGTQRSRDLTGLQDMLTRETGVINTGKTRSLSDLATDFALKGGINRAQKDSNISQIQGWYNQVLGQQAAGAQSNAAGADAATSDMDKATAAMVAALGGSPGAAGVANTGLLARGALAGEGLAQKNFDTSMRPIVGLQGAEAQTGEANRMDNAYADLGAANTAAKQDVIRTFGDALTKLTNTGADTRRDITNKYADAGTALGLQNTASQQDITRNYNDAAKNLRFQNQQGITGLRQTYQTQRGDLAAARAADTTKTSQDFLDQAHALAGKIADLKSAQGDETTVDQAAAQKQAFDQWTARSALSIAQGGATRADTAAGETLFQQHLQDIRTGLQTQADRKNLTNLLHGNSIGNLPIGDKLALEQKLIGIVPMGPKGRPTMDPIAAQRSIVGILTGAQQTGATAKAFTTGAMTKIVADWNTKYKPSEKPRYIIDKHGMAAIDWSDPRNARWKPKAKAQPDFSGGAKSSSAGGIANTTDLSKYTPQERAGIIAAQKAGIK